MTKSKNRLVNFEQPNNEFRFLGRVFTNPKAVKRTEDNDPKEVFFVLAIKNTFSGKVNHLPMIIKNSDAQLAYLKCRVGSLVAVSGYVEPREFTSGNPSVLLVKPIFVVIQFYKLSDPKKIHVSPLNFDRLLANSMVFPWNEKQFRPKEKRENEDDKDLCEENEL